MRIGTITFHWAENYGAVLQAYALQQYLQKKGYNTEIIDYRPISLKIIGFFSSIKHGKIPRLFPTEKEKKIREFRNNELILSPRRYLGRLGLRFAKHRYSEIIAGSDQIWNESFINTLEGTSYFLDFAGKKTRKIAYAVSFGTEKVSDKYIKRVRPYIQKFAAVSVREIGGMEITKQLGVPSVLVCDPTLLLYKEDYLRLISGRKFDSSKVFTYMLHDCVVPECVKEELGISEENVMCDLYEWIYRIANSDLVVTNSFHGVMLSIILNKAFIAFTIPGSGMNERLTTILKYVRLTDHLLPGDYRGNIREVINNRIDWADVNARLDEFRQSGCEYLENSIS